MWFSRTVSIPKWVSLLWHAACATSDAKLLEGGVYIYVYIYIYIYIYTHTGVSFSIGEAAPITVYRTGYGECTVPVLNATYYFNCVLLYDNKAKMFVTIGIRFKHYFDIVFYVLQSLTSQDVFVPGPSVRISDSTWYHRTLYVTSRYSTRIFYRIVSGFATDCPCGVLCLGLATCLMYGGPLFGNRHLNNSWAVGLT